jgi:hypothetical protein
MRRGCISLGNIKCDECHRTIPYPNRYLSIDVDKENSQKLCMDCCIEKGMVKPESDKAGAEMLFDLSNE